jgi:hypothetical protein
MAHNFRTRLRRLELVRGGASAHAIHEAQLRLAAGEDLPPGKAADVARKIIEFLSLVELRTAPPA